jgi:hypothetical protein
MSNSPTALVIDRMFQWWQAPAGDRNAIFAPEFAYAGVSPMVTATDWLYVIEQRPQWSDIRVLGQVIDGDRGALFFEGTETATNLRHRVGWLIRTTHGLVVSLTETMGTIEP